MIRAATVDDAPAIGHVHVESWRSTYRGLMPDAVLDKLSAEQRAAFWQRVIERAETVLVATDEIGNTVGFANGGSERDTVYTAELYALYLLKEQQGHGYGKALMLALSKKFIEQSHNAMLLWVLSSNPSRGFYEAIGGKYLKTKLIEIGSESLEEVAYGWTGLGDFLDRYASASA